MIYILCEGEKDKSDYSLCKAIVELYCKNYIIASSYGNVGLIREFKTKIVPLFQAGDVFALFFDSVESIHGIPTEDLLDEINNICESHKVKFFHTSYYCVEEIFLSYSVFLAMTIQKLTQVDDAEYGHMLQFVYKHINSEADYYRLADNCIPLKQFILERKLYTREQCSKALCYSIAPKLGRLYGITKAYLGDCWIKDCSSIRATRKGSIRCSDCSYVDKYELFYDKFKYMQTNSVLKFGMSFFILNQAGDPRENKTELFS